MKVLISGAGIAGLTLAITLNKLGHEVILIEKAPCIRQGGYMLDFFGAGYIAAEKLNLIKKMQKIHYGVGSLNFVNEKGDLKFKVEYKKMRPLFNNRHFNFMRGD